MTPVKVGLIGLGIMGKNHLKTLLEQTENYELVAVCDTDPAKLDLPELKNIAKFTNYKDLLDANLCEAVGIATPHPCHAEIAVAAFHKKLHVLCEKPLTETCAKTDWLLQEAKKAGTVFSTDFTMRTTAVNIEIRKWMQEKRLGKILRVDFICTEWIRSQYYYDMQSWRGTWLGEGGGILMNQAPHNLDLLYWWFGDMASVRAELGARLHKIETEDEVDATFITKQGVPIHFYANTFEAPGCDRIEIVGDRGTLIREAGKLRFKALKRPVSELLAIDNGFPVPEMTEEVVEVKTIPRGAPIIWKNFAAAIRENAPLIAPGQDAYAAVEMANAMLLSHFKGQRVNWPVDRQEYDQLLQDLIAKKVRL